MFVCCYISCRLWLCRTPLSLHALTNVARAGGFGRALAPEEQAFIVISDSVMKQLDGLKVWGLLVYLGWWSNWWLGLVGAG